MYFFTSIINIMINNHAPVKSVNY